MQKLNKLDSIVNLQKINPREQYHYEIDKNQDWLEEILKEIHENMTDRSIEQYINDAQINLTLSLKKNQVQPFGNVLLTNGNLEVTFFTECVKTLQEMREDLKIEFKACFIENHFAEDPEYSDLDETFIENDIYDVHFYEKNQVNLKELIHELVYLNMDPYPNLESDHDSLENAPSHTKQ